MLKEVNTIKRYMGTNLEIGYDYFNDYSLEEENEVKSGIWNFRESGDFSFYENILRNYFTSCYTEEELKNTVLIPLASSRNANYGEKYGKLLKYLENEVGIQNGMGLLNKKMDKVEIEKRAIFPHTSHFSKEDIIVLDSEKISGKNIILFDDLVRTDLSSVNIKTLLDEHRPKNIRGLFFSKILEDGCNKKFETIELK
nr:hypothetical protein [uncultured Cetobacterium sp.]